MQQSNFEPNANTNIKTLVHDQEAHQYELKEQNESLKQSTDNAERLKSRFVTLFNYSPTPNLIVNRSGRLVDFNRAAIDILYPNGTISNGEFLGRGVSLDKYAPLAKHLLHAKHSGDVVSLDVTWILSKNKKHLVFNTRYLESEDEFLIVVHDITGETERKQALEKAKREAERSSLLKSEFLANMSHEIRTPLASILGYIEIISKEINYAQPNLLKYFSRVESNAEHLMSIINDILDISKIEAGQVSLELSSAPIREEIHKTARSLLGKAYEKGIKIDCTLSDNLPRTLLLDVAKVRQVIFNLLGNALKFTNDGHIEVHVDWLTDGPSHVDGLLKISVTDSGSGIPAEETNKLFKNFSQLTCYSNRSQGGTGLGLAISRKLARLHNGDVFLESTELGKGSTFVATFGANFTEENSAQKDNSVESVEKTKSKNTSNKLEGLKILSAEDSKDLQLILKIYLRKAGAEVDFANDGFTAVTKAMNSNYDLILMDMEMPDCDGLEAMKILRKNSKLNTPVIALTAHALAEERKRCMNAGFADFISKPIDEKHLIESIEFSVQENNKKKLKNENKNSKQLSQKDIQLLSPKYYNCLSRHLETLKMNIKNKNFGKAKSQVQLLRQMAKWMQHDDIVELFDAFLASPDKAKGLESKPWNEIVNKVISYQNMKP